MASGSGERYDFDDVLSNNGEDGGGATMSIHELSANGVSMDISEVKAKLDDGNIVGAESCLREGLFLNSEEARFLLGRLEYERGHLEGALHVFDGIDFMASLQRMQPSTSEKPSRKFRSRSGSSHVVSYHATIVLLGAMYLKAKSLQSLERFNEAAHECESLLNAVERILFHGIPDIQVESRLQETISKVVELLPELWMKAGCYQEALLAYRRAIIRPWNLDNDCLGRIQNAFAVFLLFSGVEFAPPSSDYQTDGSYVPRNNIEEAIILLLSLLRMFHLGKTGWDPSVIELLTFALSLCGQTCVLAKQFEEVMPGIFKRVDRWKSLALCYSGAGENQTALNLLRKSLHRHERPDDLIALLFACKICSKDPHLAAEGVKYAERALVFSNCQNDHFKGVILCLLSLCLKKQFKLSSSNFERSCLQSEALKSLSEAIVFEPNNFEIIFEMGAQYVEHGNLNAALGFAKQFVDATGGSMVKGWRLLSLILCAQLRFSEAEEVIDAALDETTKWMRGPLLRIKAMIQISLSLPTNAIETFRMLLALVEAQRKSVVPSTSLPQVEEPIVGEFDVWHDLAKLYSSLSRWRDAEICLEKARLLKQYSSEILHIQGLMYEGQQQNYEALYAYVNARLLEPDYMPCKISLSALLVKMGSVALPVARTLVLDALRVEPSSRSAWYYLGVIHKNDGRSADAADCFQAACILEECDPIQRFSSFL